MSRIYSLYLIDILECCGRIRTYLAGFTFDTFIQDQLRVDAVVRNLEIIGEAVKSLPDELRSQRPEIEWKKISRFRDVIVHHYFKVDYDVVWSITQTKIDDIEVAASYLLSVQSAIEDSG